MYELGLRIFSETVCDEHLGDKLRLAVARSDVDDEPRTLAGDDIIKSRADSLVMLVDDELRSVSLELERNARKRQRVVQTSQSQTREFVRIV